MESHTSYKIGTFNVLFKYPVKLVNFVADPDTRHKYQIETLIPSLDVDVLSLNEVGEEHYQNMVANEKIKSMFPYITEWPEYLRTYKGKHGGVILSKYPIEVFRHENVGDNKLSRNPFCLVSFPNGQHVIVANAHLAHGAIPDTRAD